MKLSPGGFTLTELIVVITILAILATIAFLALSGYSAKSRDAVRLTSLNSYAKSLDLSYTLLNTYPLPDNSFAVTYSGATLWNQGTIGDGVMTRLRAMSTGGIEKKLVDPLTGREFKYSSLTQNGAYQMSFEYESGWSSAEYRNPLVPKTVYVLGNYGGIAAKTMTGGMVYVVASPSILTSSGITAGSGVVLSGLGGTLLLTEKSSQGATSFIPGTLVFSGASLPRTDGSGAITGLMTNLRLAYSGSDLTGMRSVSELLSGGSNTSTVVLGSSVIKNQLGGVVVMSDIASGPPPINAVCSGVSNTCSTGSPTGYSAGSCGGSQTWSCTGSNGGSTASCSIANTACVVSPTNLVLTHSANSKNLTVAWTAGSNNASCRLQFNNAGTWTDIASALSLNCDASTSTTISLNGDGWKSSWGGTPVRLVRNSDNSSVGTFAQNLNCTITSGNTSSTPNFDENCNGLWDDSSITNTNYDCSYNSCSSYWTTCGGGWNYSFNGTYTLCGTCTGWDGYSCGDAVTPPGGTRSACATSYSCSIYDYLASTGELYAFPFWSLNSCSANYSWVYDPGYSCQQTSCTYISQTCSTSVTTYF